MYYAIQIIGYGKKKVYTIVKVKNNCVNPTDGKRYKNEFCALEAAEKQNITIKIIGDFWHII